VKIVWRPSVHHWQVHPQQSALFSLVLSLSLLGYSVGICVTHTHTHAPSTSTRTDACMPFSASEPQHTCERIHNEEWLQYTYLELSIMLVSFDLRSVLQMPTHMVYGTLKYGNQHRFPVHRIFKCKVMGLIVMKLVERLKQLPRSSRAGAHVQVCFRLKLLNNQWWERSLTGPT
jgi:hypothetical protein